jgi:hypothetical protein
MYGRSRAGQIVYFINFQIYGIDNIVADQFKMRKTHQMDDISFIAGKKIIQANDVVAFPQQSVAKM